MEFENSIKSSQPHNIIDKSKKELSVSSEDK